MPISVYLMHLSCYSLQCSYSFSVFYASVTLSSIIPLGIASTFIAYESFNRCCIPFRTDAANYAALVGL
jgi:hypothetical protein